MAASFDAATEILRTHRLDLVTLTANVCQAVLDGRRDDVAALLGVDPGDWPREAERRGAFPGYLEVLRADPSYAAWLGRAIVLRERSLVIGSVNLKGPPTEDGRVEIGYGLSDAHQRQGYAREAVAAMLQYAFAVPDVQRVIAQIEPDNHRSVRLAETLGFVATGAPSRQHRDHAIWRLTRKAYEANAGGRE